MKKLSKNQKGFGAIEAVVIIVVIILIAGLGYMVYKNHHKTKQASTTVTTTDNPSSSRPMSNQPVDPYAGWKTYTSAYEGLSFKYPSSWNPVTPKVASTDPKADSFEVKSPSGSIDVAWVSYVSGIGGACNDQIMPGTQVGVSSMGPCAYWTVVDKQKLASANLYYVDGVVTGDGKNYSPWCALQATTGITKSESNIGYLLFNGKHGNQVGLMCGFPFNGYSPTKTTKNQAVANLSSSEMKQAKLILLSASY